MSSKSAKVKLKDTPNAKLDTKSVSERAKTPKETPKPVEASTRSLLKSFIVISFIVLILAGFVYYQHVQSLSSEEIEFSTMPDQVHQWMEKGQFIPFRDGKQTNRLFVVNQKHPADTETVLFLHDFHTTSFTFRGIAKSFEQSGVTFVAFDMPGFGLSDPPTGDLSEAAAVKIFKSLVHLLKLRSFHLVCQGSSARMAVRFALDMRAKVKSIAFSGVDLSGFSTFTPPPYYHRAIGHFLSTSVPGFSHYALEWYRSRASATFTREIFECYTFLQTCRGGRDYFLDAKEYFFTVRKTCGYTCEAEFQVQALGLNLNTTSIFAPRNVFKTSRAAGYSAALFSDGAFPSEVDPERFSMHLKKFVHEQTPTAEAPPEAIPEHIQRQLDAGMGHTHDHGHEHDHGHHDHSHGNDGHGEGYGL
eukprot:m.61898 g.61898  ORF g.61898 m.61898 type:complete len:417 (+) comp23053_c0_seq2:53-1303(+)